MIKILSPLLFSLTLVVSATAHAQLEPINEVFTPPGQYPREQWSKIAVVQWAPRGSAPITTDPGIARGWKQRNRLALEEYIREAAQAGAELVVTPEFGVVGYPNIPDLPDEEDNWQNQDQIRPYAEELDGESTQFFGALARELRIYIHFGFAQAMANGNFRNSVVVVGPNGNRIANYSKIHLYQNENRYLEAGNTISTYTGPFGKVGLVICSDVYSGHPMRSYANQSLDLLALSTSWAQWNTGMTHFQSAARWVRAHVAAANQSYFPDSGVINPNGTKQSHIRQSDGVAYGYLPRQPTF